MEIREHATIDAPLATTWTLLQDVDLVTSCLPGASLHGIDEEGRHMGSLTVQFGPTQVTFQGNVLFRVSEAAHRIELSGRGRDGRGRNRASVELAVTASELPGNRTGLDVVGDITVTGPLESFASTGGRHLAQVLLGEFTGNMTNALGAPTPSLADSGSDQDRPLSFWRLLSGALRSWLRSLRTGSRADR